MSLLDTLAKKISDSEANYVQFGIPAERVQNVKYDSSPVSAGSGYFRVWAVEMKVNDGGPLVDYYSVLHSVVRFDYAGKPVELTRVTGLDSLSGSTGGNVSMGKVMALNFPLTELMPFNGGTLELSAGLLAMKEKDRVQSAIKMATDFSALLAIPQLSSVLSLAQPLANNIEQLVGMGDNQFRLGYHNTFASANGGGSNDLKPQYIAIIGSQTGDAVARDGAGHWVINDHLCYINPDPNATDKNPVEIPRDYILLRFEVRRSRGEEWNNLPALNEPFVESLRLLTSDETKSKAQLKRAILQILESPDIAENDREAIAKQLRDKYDSRASLLSVESPGDLDAIMGPIPSLSEAIGDAKAGDQKQRINVNDLLNV